MEPIGNSQVLSYLRHIYGKGIKFLLISFEKKEYFDDNSQKDRLCKELKGYDIEWHSLKYHKRFRVFATLFDMTAGVLKSVLVIKKSKTDIVHARSYIAALIAWVVTLFTKLKFVFDMRGFWPDERVDAGLLKKDSLLYRFIKRLECMLINRADKIVVLTHKAKVELIAKFTNIKNDKIKIIPCCTDTSLFKFNLDVRNKIRSRYNIDGRFVFIHTGSFIGWYMIREMLEYFKTIKEIEKKALFMFLYTARDLTSFWETVDNADISRKDILTVEVPFEEVHRYLSSADAGLFFIKPTFSKRASCPIKFAEYMSCGLPVVCNRNIGDLDGIIEENKVGLLVNDFNKTSYTNLYGKLKELLNDKGLKTRCRMVATDLFDVDKGAESYLELYRANQ